MTLTSFTAAWLQDAPAATRLLPRRYHSASEREGAVRTAQQHPINPAVLASFRAATAAQQTNLAALANGAVCVVTGQQAGLFGGPLYTLYKAAAAIVNARALAAETGVPCVPIFWLQNEDHDYAEIDHCTVLGGDGLQTLQVPGADDRRRVSARTLGPGVHTALAALGDALGGQSEAEAVLGILGAAYTADASPDGAFRALVEHWFADSGLLILDPSDPSLRAAAASIHRRAFAEAPAIAAALQAHSTALSSAGFKVQVHVRPSAPLFFFHPEGADGPRFRIDGELRLCGPDRTLTAAEIEAGIDAGSVSTSALLRPLLQDLWLPTAAYVGGPGEIAYFAQLPPLYAHFGRPMPLVVPRARFELVDGTSQRLLEQLGLTLTDLDHGHDALLRRVADPGEGPDPDALQTQFAAGIGAPLQSLRAHADTRLTKQIDKTQETLLGIAGRLLDRYRRERAQSDEVAVQRLGRLLSRQRPQGAPQERILSWPAFAGRHPQLVDEILRVVVPFDGSLKALPL